MSPRTNNTSLILGLIFLLANCGLAHAQPLNYPWLSKKGIANTLQERITPPNGAQRIPVTPESYGHWLRNLPLKPEGAPVLLYSGKRKSSQNLHTAVIDIDVGNADLQQCADAIIRFRAEYLFSRHPQPNIEFRYTTGDRISFKKWADGWRPKVIEYRVSGKRKWRVDWQQTQRPKGDYPTFRAYLDNIFMYAGTASLATQNPKRAITDVQIGDFYLQGGHPGHAVLIVDLAEHPTEGKLALLAQSYMPAQSPHILRNLNEPRLSPWFRVKTSGKIRTPEWTFFADEIYHF